MSKEIKPLAATDAARRTSKGNNQPERDLARAQEEWKHAQDLSARRQETLPPDKYEMRRLRDSYDKGEGTVSYDEIKKAHNRLKEHGLIIQTPCDWSQEISNGTRIRTYLKEEYK